MDREKSDHRGPEATGIRARLEELRSALLDLHKSLVDSERIEYEKVIGKIQSPGQFLQLLTNDPWFAWLSPLSRLIVSIDEALDEKEPLSARSARGFADEAQHLLVAAEQGEGFASHYHEALQRDPGVVLAHAEVAKLRKKGRQ